MRLFSYALLMTLFVCASTAQARVLLPETGPDRPRPNLGLTPTFSTQKSKKTTPAVAPKVISPLKSTAVKNGVTQKNPIIQGSNSAALEKIFTKNKSKNEIDLFIEKLTKTPLSNGPEPKTLEDARKQPANPIFIKRKAELEALTKKYLAPVQLKVDNHKLQPGGTVPEKELSKAEKYMAAYSKLPISERERNIKRSTEIAMKKYQDAFNKKIAMAPLIHDEVIVETDDINTHHKKKLDVSLNSKYIWGEKDIEWIQRAFGYARADIPKLCQLRYKLTVKTTDDSRYKVLWSGKTETIKYSGNIIETSGSYQAVCQGPKAFPQKGSIISKVGSNYGIGLSSADACKPQQQNVYKLSLKYIGDGKAECTLR